MPVTQYGNEKLEVTIAELQALFGLVGSKMSIVINKKSEGDVIEINILCAGDYKWAYKELLERMRYA